MKPFKLQQIIVVQSPVQSDASRTLLKGYIFTEHNPPLHIADLSPASSSSQCPAKGGSSVQWKVHEWWKLATCITMVNSGGFTTIVELTPKSLSGVDPSPSGLDLLSSRCVRQLSSHCTGLQWITVLLKVLSSSSLVHGRAALTTQNRSINTTSISCENRTKYNWVRL